MSILDNENYKLEEMDGQANDFLFKKISSYLHARHFPNNVAKQYAYDAFNIKIIPGDWAIYNINTYGGPNNYKIVKVESITKGMVRILKFVRGYENPQFVETTVNASSLIKILNKSDFYKEFENNNYINKNQ